MSDDCKGAQVKGPFKQEAQHVLSFLETPFDIILMQIPNFSLFIQLHVSKNKSKSMTLETQIIAFSLEKIKVTSKRLACKFKPINKHICPCYSG